MDLMSDNEDQEPMIIVEKEMIIQNEKMQLKHNYICLLNERFLDL